MHHVYNYVICGTVAQPKEYNKIVQLYTPLKAMHSMHRLLSIWGGSLYHLSFALGRVRFFCLLLKIGKCLGKRKKNTHFGKVCGNLLRVFRCTLKDGMLKVKFLDGTITGRGRFEKIRSSLTDKTTLNGLSKSKKNI